MRKLRVLDVFSGIGGFSLGLERTGGFETVAFCEIEEFPRKVLAKHWPNVPIHRDIRELYAARLGRIDLICGGYPCQPFSTAGKRLGAEDDRHLWPEMFRLVKACRPSWVIGENVAGHVSMGLDQVLSDLDGLGYTSQTFVIPACAVDAPHRRDRVWIVANAGCELRQGAVEEPSGQSKGIWNKTAVYPQQCSKTLAHSISDGQSRSGTFGITSNSETPEEGKTIDAVNGCVGSIWSVEPDVGRVAHGVPNRVDRLKALGNAVVPQIPELIGRAILASMQEAA